MRAGVRVPRLVLRVLNSHISNTDRLVQYIIQSWPPHNAAPAIRQGRALVIDPQHSGTSSPTASPGVWGEHNALCGAMGCALARHRQRHCSLKTLMADPTHERFPNKNTKERGARRKVFEPRRDARNVSAGARGMFAARGTWTNQHMARADARNAAQPSGDLGRPQEPARNRTFSHQRLRHDAHKPHQLPSGAHASLRRAAGNIEHECRQIKPHRPVQTSRTLMGSKLKAILVCLVAPHTGGRRCRFSAMAVNIAGHDK